MKKRKIKYEEIDTNRLSELWFKGEKLAFVVLYERYYDKAIFFTRSYTKNRAEIIDIVHETFAKIFEKVNVKKEPIENFEQYLFSSLKFNFFDKNRTEKSRKKKRESLLSTDSFSSNNTSQFEVHDFQKHIQQYLTPKQATVLKLHLQGKSNKQIAEETDLGNANAIGSILNRAKKKIKDVFGEENLKSELSS